MYVMAWRKTCHGSLVSLYKAPVTAMNEQQQQQQQSVVMSQGPMGPDQQQQQQVEGYLVQGAQQNLSGFPTQSMAMPAPVFMDWPTSTNAGVWARPAPDIHALPYAPVCGAAVLAMGHDAPGPSADATSYGSSCSSRHQNNLSSALSVSSGSTGIIDGDAHVLAHGHATSGAEATTNGSG